MQGVFRFVGGSISKRKAVTITTPSSAITIRGGIMMVAVDPAETRATFLYGQAMTVTSHGKSQIVTGPARVTRAAQRARAGDADCSWSVGWPDGNARRARRSVHWSRRRPSRQPRRAWTSNANVRRRPAGHAQRHADTDDREPDGRRAERPGGGGGEPRSQAGRVRRRGNFEIRPAGYQFRSRASCAWPYWRISTEPRPRRRSSEGWPFAL